MGIIPGMVTGAPFTKNMQAVVRWLRDYPKMLGCKRERVVEGIERQVQMEKRAGGDPVYLETLVGNWLMYEMIHGVDAATLQAAQDEELLSIGMQMSEKFGVHVPQPPSIMLFTSVVMSRWYLAGQKVYEISPGLAQRLSHTKLTGINAELLRLPYRALSIRIPKEVGLPYEEVVITEGAEAQLPDFSSLETKNSFARHVVEKATALGKWPRCWRIGVMANRGENKAGQRFFHFYLWDGEPLEQLLHDNFSFEWEETLVKAFQLAMNTILYTTWPDTGEEFIERVDSRWKELKARLEKLPRGHKRTRVKEELEYTFADRRIYLGAKVPFMAVPEESGKDGQKLNVRTLVSGHWKMQPCGPHWSERKLIRVEPFWRGPLDGAISNPIRKVS